MMDTIDRALKSENRRKVRVRAALIVIIVSLASAIFTSAVGIHFSTKEISNTVADDLTLLGDISSGMILSTIEKMNDDALYVGGMMERAYTEGGIEKLTETLQNEIGTGPNFISLGVVFPDGTVISSEKKDFEFAKLLPIDAKSYLRTAPSEGTYISNSAITASGKQVIRCYYRLSSGAVFISTLRGDYFSNLLSSADYDVYSSARVFIIDGQGTVIADSYSGDTNKLGSSFINSTGGFGEAIRDALFGDITDSVVVRYDDDFEDAGGIICSYTPLSHKNARWALFVTVPVSNTPIPNMRNLFIISGLMFLVFGAIASIFLSKMQVKPYEVLDRQNILLKELKAEAEAGGRAKGDFLSNMSHEIRTPLNAVIGMTEIAKNTNDENKRYESLVKIDDASRHLMGVINDILDMSKIEANKLELDPIDFRFADMVNRVSDITSFRIVEKRQDYSVDIDPNIPPYLHCDEQRLAQVITNLLTNAVKFTPEGGSIELAAKLIGEEAGTGGVEIEIYVKDSGIGVSDEQKSRLFTSFEQAESSTSRKYGGTGLGLAISKHIVEMMDGRIWVDSVPGQGSRFSFVIKAGIAEGATSDIDVSYEPLIANEFAGKTILLAEDIEINREIVCALLEPTGIDIVEAVNGRDAVDKYAEAPEKYDLILMDVQMPELDGYQATEIIREMEQELAESVPIIAMTANVFKEDIDKALAVGMNAHIGKPLNMKQVLEQLRFYLGRSD
ncbi:MAG: response regulator [Clostridiales Family XIII bacterium]|jgi:signal transduction histidine kinase/CheY-like chemotaxis protein|nr:response regulator [Clostridiales Family XIII bacterium]